MGHKRKSAPKRRRHAIHERSLVRASTLRSELRRYALADTAAAYDVDPLDDRFWMTDCHQLGEMHCSCFVDYACCHCGAQGDDATTPCRLVYVEPMTMYDQYTGIPTEDRRMVLLSPLQVDLMHYRGEL